MPICRVWVLLLAMGVSAILPVNSWAAIAEPPTPPELSENDDGGSRSVITWTPQSVEESLFPGDIQVVTVSFTASKNIRRAEVTVSPELASFVRPDLMFLERLRRGKCRELNLIFSLPADAQPSTVSGTVAVARVEDDDERDTDDSADSDRDSERQILAQSLDVLLTIRRRPVATAEWSTYQHDSQRTGRSPYVGPIAAPVVQPILDITPTHGGEALAVAPDRRIWNGGINLVALNPDGSLSADIVLPLLATPFGASRAVITSLTIAGDGTIYASVEGLDFPNTGGIYAFTSDGTLRWQRDFGGQVSTPTLGSDGTIYFSTSVDFNRCNKSIFALRPDGTDLWEYNYDGCAGLNVPAVAPDGTVVVTGTLFRSFFVEAHEPTTGALRWSLDLGVEGVRAPSVAQDGTVYVVTGRALYAVSSSTGNILWIHSFPNPIGPSVPSIAADGTIVVASVLTIGLERTQFVMLESFTPAGALKRSIELAPSAAIAPCQIGGPQVALDANGNAYVSLNATCSAIFKAPLLFGVTADGFVNWTVDGFFPRNLIVGAPDTLYGIGVFFDQGVKELLFRVTSR